ncbi:hypothetical protein [Bradyrhizobium sp. USDA 336]|uniref:hypothetical protein n=1 Tax=Bradyrhizobium sp. USDA 336 TaxID=3156311 RepID=UPI00383268CE
MLDMHSEWRRQLPYQVHTNRELGLMLQGTKPLAYFTISLAVNQTSILGIGECSTGMSLKAA